MKGLSCFWPDRWWIGLFRPDGVNLKGPHEPAQVLVGSLPPRRLLLWTSYSSHTCTRFFSTKRIYPHPKRKLKQVHLPQRSDIPFPHFLILWIPDFESVLYGKFVKFLSYPLYLSPRRRNNFIHLLLLLSSKSSLSYFVLNHLLLVHSSQY